MVLDTILHIHINLIYNFYRIKYISVFIHRGVGLLEESDELCKRKKATDIPFVAYLRLAVYL